MNDRAKWVSEARAGVEAERRRLEKDGPSLERHRRPVAEFSATDQKNGSL
ncbi:hypothetical protein [Ruegeria sp. 6PALISEP08]|nr:hypothetical protein [Ruegeria sp. 6PALISEP08]